MSWFKGLFGGKSDASQSVVQLSDREYEHLFNQVLQGVAASWDEQRLLKLLGDRLLSEPRNPTLTLFRQVEFEISTQFSK